MIIYMCMKVYELFLYFCILIINENLFVLSVIRRFYDEIRYTIELYDLNRFCYFI